MMFYLLELLIHYINFINFEFAKKRNVQRKGCFILQRVNVCINTEIYSDISIKHRLNNLYTTLTSQS